MKPNRIICVLIFIFVVNSCIGQSFDLGSWNILNVKYKISKKWTVFAETQLRSLKFYDHFHYYEYVGGANFQVHPNIGLTLATGNYKTYKEGGNFITPINNNEFRFWPQVTLSQTIGAFKIEHRLRVEFRFTSQGYKNRFRYRAALILPLGKDKKGYKPFQISLSNELFFTDKEPYFERNRVLLSLAYRFSKQFSMQMGFLHQFDYKINDETGRDFLQIGLNIEMSRKTK